MAGQIISREQLTNQVVTTVPQLVKESGSKVDRFLGTIVSGTSKLAFVLGLTSPFRMTTRQNPEFPFSGELSDRERIKLNAYLTGISSDRSW